MKIFPTGKDANYFWTLVLAGTVFAVFKLLREGYPEIANLFGLLAIGGLVLYLLFKIVKKRQLKSSQGNTNLYKSSPKRNYVFLMLLAVLILAFGFYWFELRPMNARAECNTTARDKANATNDPIRAYDTFYEVCLHSKGL